MCLMSKGPSGEFTAKLARVHSVCVCWELAGVLHVALYLFIIDLSTFHNLPLEVSPHWLPHCMLCLKLPSGLAGLYVPGSDTLSGLVPAVFLLSEECALSLWRLTLCSLLES